MSYNSPGFDDPSFVPPDDSAYNSPGFQGSDPGYQGGGDYTGPNPGADYSNDNSTDSSAAAFADQGGTDTSPDNNTDPTESVGTKKSAADMWGGDTSSDPTESVGQPANTIQDSYNPPDPTESVGQPVDDGSDASNLAQAANPIPTSDPTESVGMPAFADQGGTSTAPTTDPTESVGAPADSIQDSYNPDFQVQDSYNPPDQKQGGGSLWDRIKSTASDVGAQIKDSIDPNQEGWLPHLDYAPNLDIKGDVANAAEGLGTVAGYATDVWNRGVAESGLAANDLIRNANPNAVLDYAATLPYDVTGQQMPWQGDTNYQAAQVLAEGGNGLSTILPGTAGGGDAGIYDVPVVGGAARAAKAVWDAGTGGGDPSIDTEQLQKDIASGQYTDKQLQEKYPGNEAYRVIQEVLNPINFVEPEIGGVKAGDIISHVLSAPTARAIDTLADTTRATGWTPEASQAADTILAQRGTIANRGIADLAAPDAARALTDIRVNALPALESVSGTQETLTQLVDGAARLGQYDGLGTVGTDALKASAQDEAVQIARDLSLRNTGGDGATQNYLDMMDTIRRGNLADLTAHTNSAGDTIAQLAKGTANTAADLIPQAETLAPQKLAEVAAALKNGELPQRNLVQAADQRGINLNTATAAQMEQVRAEATRSLVTEYVRAAMYDKAGAALPGTESALHKGLAGTFNAVRGLLLMASAPPLALQKFSDEWVRALSQGVVSVRPQDLATLQAAARFGADRNVLGQADRFRGFLDNGTIQHAVNNDVMVPAGLNPRTAKAAYGIKDAFAPTNRYGEPMKAGDRVAAVAGAPFRAIGKFNDSLIGAPTQHVILNAFYHDTKTLDRTRAAIADKAYQDVLAAGFGPEEAGIVQDRLKTATTQRDFVRIGRDIQNSTGVRVDTSPAVPSAGMAKGTPYSPSNRVINDMNRTGGEFGLVGKAGETSPAVQSIIDGHTVPSFEDIKAAQAGNKGTLPNPYANPKNVGSAGGGMGQPIRGDGIDLAAGGDGGAGYLSRQFRGSLPSNDLNAAGGFGSGRTLDYGTPKGAPRTANQSALDSAAATRRGAMLDGLHATGSLDGTLAAIDPKNLAEIKLNQVAANTEIKYAQSELARGVHAGNEAAVYRDLAEMERFANRLAEMRTAIDPAYTSDRLAQERFGARPVPSAQERLDTLAQMRGGDVRVDNTAGPRQIGSDARFTPTQPDPTEIGAPAGNGGFRPVERNAFAPTESVPAPLAPHERGTIPLGAPRDAQALATAGETANQALIGRGAELARTQREAVAAGTQRGYRIIGNQGDQTTLGSWMKNGIGGVTPPVLPFAPFHIHSAQFWAREFANHPALAVGVAQALGNLDDYGTLHLPGGQTIGDLTKLLTGAHLVDWAMKAYKYDQAVGAQGRNSPLQRIGKDVAYNTVGNNAFVRPFEYVGSPINSFVQQHTNPLMSGKTDFATGAPLVDSRDQVRESGTMAGLTGIGQSINDRFGQPVPRNLVTTLTNPGQAIGNGLGSLVSRIPGSVDVKQYNFENQIPYKAQEIMAATGFDTKRFQAGEADAMTGSPQTPDGKAILDAFQHVQDQAAVGRIAPIQLGTDEKGIYPPTAHTPTETAAYYRSLDYQQRAGSGGKDLGTGIPAGSFIETSGKNAGQPNPYYVESPASRQVSTAMADIAKANPVSPDSVPFMDYNRAFLARPDVQAGATPNQQKALPGEIAGNASRTGAGLPQDARMAQIAKEQVLQQPVGTNPDGTPFTLGDLLKQPGNVNSIEAQLKGMAAGPQKTALEAALADAKAKDSAQSSVAGGYFAQQDAAYKASLVDKVTGNPKTDGLNKSIDGNFTVSDFLNQPGNVFDLEGRIKGLPSGPQKTALEKQLDAVLMSDLKIHPEVAGYFGASGQLDVAQNGYHPTNTYPSSSKSGGTSSKSGYTPYAKSGKTFVPYSAAQRAAYGRSLGSSGSGSSSATTAAISARADFNTVFQGLSKSEQAAAYKDPALAGVLTKGSKPSADEWAAATRELNSLTKKNASGTSVPSGTPRSTTGSTTGGTLVPSGAGFRGGPVTQADLDWALALATRGAQLRAQGLDPRQAVQEIGMNYAGPSHAATSASAPAAPKVTTTKKPTPKYPNTGKTAKVAA